MVAADMCLQARVQRAAHGRPTGRKVPDRLTRWESTSWVNWGSIKMSRIHCKRKPRMSQATRGRLIPVYPEVLDLMHVTCAAGKRIPNTEGDACRMHTPHSAAGTREYQGARRRPFAPEKRSCGDPKPPPPVPSAGGTHLAAPRPWPTFNHGVRPFSRRQPAGGWEARGCAAGGFPEIRRVRPREHLRPAARARQFAPNGVRSFSGG